MTPANQPPAASDEVKQFACACANVRRASRAITQFYDSLFQAGGYSIGQYGLLHSLALTKIATQAQFGGDSDRRSDHAQPHAAAAVA